MQSENYIKNFNNFDKISVYDFKLGEGGIGDYLRFYMIILTKCMCNNIKLYIKINKMVVLACIFLKSPCTLCKRINYRANCTVIKAV